MLRLIELTRHRRRCRAPTGFRGYCWDRWHAVDHCPARTSIPASSGRTCPAHPRPARKLQRWAGRGCLTTWNDAACRGAPRAPTPPIRCSPGPSPTPSQRRRRGSPTRPRKCAAAVVDDRRQPPSPGCRWAVRSPTPCWPPPAAANTVQAVALHHLGATAGRFVRDLWSSTPAITAATSTSRPAAWYRSPRWAAGSPSSPATTGLDGDPATPRRRAGLLTADETETLVRAFEYIYGLDARPTRSKRSATGPTHDHLDRPQGARHVDPALPAEAFRAVAEVQNRLDSEWVARLP